MAELDEMRGLLEQKAGELEAAQKSTEAERDRLLSEFESKVSLLTDAKGRMEQQVSKLEAKEQQLKQEWAGFEAERANAVREAEVSSAGRELTCLVLSCLVCMCVCVWQERSIGEKE